MKFSEIVKQASLLLKEKGRASYRMLQREFDLDAETLEDLKDELIEVDQLAVDKDGKMLVWIGGPEAADEATSTPTEPSVTASPTEAHPPEGERRQLTVMFCDLVGSTALSEQLDPEDLQTVVRTYQEVSAQVIERYEGYIAQYLGDGLLVYLGYPTAHEDDAARAIHAGLEIVTALSQARSRFPQPVQVRIGIHTGPVVVGQMGGGSRREQLALGETPNLAARVQGKAAPDTVVISSATYRLVNGLFNCQDLGPQDLKGISSAQSLYQVRSESDVQSRFEVSVRAGLTPLVGRTEELGLLGARWEQATAGEGQAVLLSGEAGIGKSRLIQELKDRVIREGATRMEFRCSPYHQNSALYPVIEQLHRVLQFARDDAPAVKLEKLAQTLSRYQFPQADTLGLLAALFALPHPEDAPPLTLSPQKQKQQTMKTLVAWILEEADHATVYCAWEDLHWADPSTLEILTLLLDQVPTTRMLALLVFRPEFTPPWGTRSYLSQITLGRLGRAQVEGIVERVTGGRTLPGEVVEQVVAKTDGVPLFVEELTKMIVESGLLKAVNSHYELTGPLSALAIPATLHDSLMARLDRLGTAKEVAQMGAVVGREFSHELLQAVSPLAEETLQAGLVQLVGAELVHQRGLPPHARYLFKHALIQDTAYQSLLKSRRHALHQQVAQVLEQQFAETVEAQPELVARHYTEAGRIAQAVPYWQQAGHRASRRSANVEAIGHLTQGLEVLQALPDTPERTEQELTLLATLGPVLMLTKGWAAPEVKAVYTRREELCEQMGETRQLYSVLHGLRAFYFIRAEHQTGLDLAERLLKLGQRFQDPGLVLEAHMSLLLTLLFMGEFTQAHEHCEQGIAIYDPEQHHSLAFVYGGFDPGETCLCYAGLALFNLGYPDQALKRMNEALVLAREVSHPFTLAHALFYASGFHFFRGEVQLAQEQVEEMIEISADQGFELWSAHGTIWQGYLLAAQGQGEAGITQMRQGLAAFWATGAGYGLPSWLFFLARAHAGVGQIEEGLTLLAEALQVVERTAERQIEARLYRLKGELILQKFKVQRSEFKGEKEAEECFQKALDVARQQSTKSLELGAATSLARLWLQQGKKSEACDLLAPVYEWFTEGFDTQDLIDAKALLDTLA